MSEPSTVVTRFAPSPTGYLHIGGARTALFNWLYARGHDGRFLLRIEDTDRARHSEDAVDAILKGLEWLGLDWDGEPASQFARADRHRAMADRLLASGDAYRCYATREELEAMREIATAEGRSVVYDRRWRDRDPADAPEDQPYVVRFKQPVGQDTIVHDAVFGEVRTPSTHMEDLVLLRPDGTPTYNLAVVVDDHEMGVTHVIRGDDHLANAGKQLNIYRALGWEPPVFAHVPLIHGPDGAKLSKRHGALGVEAYRDLGMLPEGLRNYLLRLGWSDGDDEFFDDAAAQRRFDIAGLRKSPARLDLEKMAAVNRQHLQRADDDRLAALAAENLKIDDTEELSRIRRAAPLLKERASTVAEFAEAAGFLVAKRPLDATKKARKALEKDDAVEKLRAVRAALHATTDWESDALDGAVATVAEARGEGLGQIGPAVRAALTGGLPSPSLGETMWALGREETLLRLDDQLTP